MSRRRFMNQKKLVFFQQRFYPAGNYTWPVPEGCTSVDVFLVGGGGGGSDGTGGGGGYTKTYKSISVTPGEVIKITVGTGATYPSRGGASYFGSYYANGGDSGSPNSRGGNGGSGGGTIASLGGSDGENGVSRSDVGKYGGSGQLYNTRDFGEPTGKRNAGGGNGENVEGLGLNPSSGGESDYVDGSGANGNRYGGVAPAKGGGGYGGGGGAARGGSHTGGKGGDGTVLIRGYKYEQL